MGTTIREDFAGQRQLRFRVEGRLLHLFKTRGESTHHVHLKVLVYAWALGRWPDLAIDPRGDGPAPPALRKHPADVAAIALDGRVRFWARCAAPGAKIPACDLSYVLRHLGAEEVVWAFEHAADDTEAAERAAAHLKHHIHYRYAAGKLKVLAVAATDDWFSPDAVEVPADRVRLVEL